VEICHSDTKTDAQRAAVFVSKQMKKRQGEKEKNERENKEAKKKENRDAYLLTYSLHGAGYYLKS
jgi:hypothetical protein